MVEWLKKIIPKVFWKVQPTFGDDLNYKISEGVLTATQNILGEYGNYEPPHEGFVYWAGLRNGNKQIIKGVIAPKTNSSEHRVSVDNSSNFEVIKSLAKNELVQIAQVHSHPSSWVGHSLGDNEMAPFKVEGLLSVVVPCYGINGLKPLTMCGIHRFNEGRFTRLQNEYITERFEITPEIEPLVIDLRKGK